MCAIQNFHLDWLIDPERQDIAGVDVHNIGRTEEDGSLLLKSDEVTHLT
jgi:hypothetical protein